MFRSWSWAAIKITLSKFKKKEIPILPKKTYHVQMKPGVFSVEGCVPFVGGRFQNDRESWEAKKLSDRWALKKTLVGWGYKGDYTTQVYRGYNKPI